MNKRNFAAISAIALMLTACANAPPKAAQHIARIQPGDNTLTCSQITGQIATMNKTIATAAAAKKKDSDGFQATSTGAEAATTALSFIPVVGGFIAAGAGMASGSADDSQLTASAQEQQTVNDARARKDVLVGLGNGKGCFATTTTASVTSK